VRESVEQAERALVEVEALLVQAPKIQASLTILQNQIEQFNERLSQAYETVGLGITAEALIHEISYIADGLGERLSEIKDYLKATSSSDPRIRAFTRHVEGTISALRKQLGHLDPALRYAREKRETIDLRVFLSEIEDYHKSRWRGGDLSILIEHLSHELFNLTINRGKLTQIFDNLIINSEYWLREDIRRKKLTKGIVKIELKPPKVWISDNGRGIDPTVEQSLFEPFVTTRKKGRGLGLFIVNEFLRSEGGSIDLYNERNAAGRLYAFEIDFSGMMGDEDDE
jgi:signal transduction histidine kinase